ncbi:MAG: COX15/CtaA family protein [Candidatus Paracaedibacter sp.]
MSLTLPPMNSTNRPLILWLLSTCFLIWLMIMLGGATRLTHAGLSIVEWNPITGIIPPLNQLQWLEAFESYKKFPEYKLVNQGMSLMDFQFIYFMEYFHRLLGRIMGLWFIVPVVIFWVRQQLSYKLKKISLLALFLGLAQGVLGWYMVKSGLVKDPAVSHYRLTAHLLLAIALYGLLFWTALELMHPPLKKSVKLEPPLIRRLSLLSCIAVTFTIFYGGLVAGSKAGLIYNTFPLMEGRFIPEEWSFYNPIWINFFENAALVQCIHRWLAISTAALILFTSWTIWHRSPQKHMRTIALIFTCAALTQITLGILTLLFHVPVILGTLHQGTAVILLSLGLYLHYMSKTQKKF